ncbi:DNA-binding domain-containing protein [Paraburkholderia caribensis]|uniref:DNA-binding domain-containing protein n=2 Tax=Paraburkholderia caribensis TaxID=75105 RepID=A0ABV0E9D8_9BURK|nr:DNA-binding domain-containing protein [Paraburkholderia caribensis]MCO4883056.1 DNA-binding domain-containing protein [Paraburkholderia caribensis]
MSATNHRWQQDFRSWLTDGSEEAARRVGSDASRGLSVYQNNYRRQLIECLDHSFPQVRTLLGADAFLHASITHIEHRLAAAIRVVPQACRRQHVRSAPSSARKRKLCNTMRSARRASG